MADQPLRRFRFAPTPSRWLHLGNGLAALIGWGAARAAGGRFILRIEDIDQTRCRSEYEAGCLADLAWLGLDWDEGPDVGGPCGPYRQSERFGRYDAVLEALSDADLAYPCRCSRAEVRAAGGGSGAPYPGTCRAVRPRKPLAEDRGGYRLDVGRATGGEPLRWTDRWLGPQEEDVARVRGDVLLGRPGRPTYHLAVVADDRDMGITDVVRGSDLADAVGQQRALYAALGAAPPQVAHHPLILGPSGSKLSKRDGDRALRSWRLDARSPDALIAALGRAVGLFGGRVRTATATDVVDALATRAPVRDGHEGDVLRWASGVAP